MTYGNRDGGGEKGKVNGNMMIMGKSYISLLSSEWQLQNFGPINSLHCYSFFICKRDHIYFFNLQRYYEH